MEEIHCGACGTRFLKSSELTRHLDRCRAAKVLIPMVIQTFLCGDKVGHPIAGLIVGIAKSGALIQKYALAVAMDMDTFKRAELHRELCLSLGISKDRFRPFEDSEITEIPTMEEAEEILWKAIELLRYSIP